MKIGLSALPAFVLALALVPATLPAQTTDATSPHNSAATQNNSNGGNTATSPANTANPNDNANTASKPNPNAANPQTAGTQPVGTTNNGGGGGWGLWGLVGLLGLFGLGRGRRVESVPRQDTGTRRVA